MSTTHPFLRDVEEPRFKLWQAGVIAAALLLLLFLMIQKSGWMQFSLSPEELLEMQAMREQRQRDLSFRFLDEAQNVAQQDNPKYLSDADRRAESEPMELDPDNEDPFSKGDTYELVNQNPKAVDSPVSQGSRPAPQRAEMPEKHDDEPQPIADDPIFQLENGPKPYRPPSAEEVAHSQQAAQARIARESTSSASAAEGRYDNQSGKRSPHMGFSVDTAGHDLGPYLKQLIELVRSNWRIPEIARLEASGVVVVYFELHQNGMIEQTTVIQNSDYEPLDMSSYNAVRNVYQAPPLPKHIQEEWIPIKFAFYYNVRPPR